MIDWSEINYLVNNDFRTISIPIKGRLAGVRNDAAINVIVIRIPRTYRGSDLSEFNIRVNYENAHGDINYQNISGEEYVVVEDEYISFAWVLSSDVTLYKGTVKFSVNLFTTEQDGTIIQDYHTTIAELKVLEGQDANESIDSETQVDIITHLENELSDYADGLETELGGLVTRAETAATNAEGYASDALSYKNSASNSAADALIYKRDAQSAATNAEIYKNDASGYASDALGYKNAASGSAADALGYKNNAADSAADALGYKNAAAASAEAAAASAAHLVIDDEMSGSSENAVQNKVITGALTTLNNALTALGLSVVDGMICQTFSA